MLVTIICNTYNHENFVSQCIDSLLMQKTNFYFEILIHDDASTDKTPEIIKDYVEKYPDLIKPIFQNENQYSKGISVTVLYQLPRAKGKYIAFCEGDDYWIDPYKLQKQVDFLEENPNYGLVHGDVNHFYQKSGKLIQNYNRSKNIRIPEGDIFEELLCTKHHLIKTMTTCFRKELIDKYFDFIIARKRKWKLLDLPFWLTIAKHSKIHYINKSLATYRLLEESVSRTKDFKRLHEFHESVFDIRYFYWEKYNRKKQIKENIDKNYYKMLINDAYEMNDIKLLKRIYFKYINFKVKLPIEYKVKYLILKNNNIKTLIDLLRLLKKMKSLLRLNYEE